ncbi:oxidoreductase [Mycena capillaripes]|nr:oxidoreductase [Mycena capillaripes]
MSPNKVILVTGSNTGIGYELVHLLAAKGHTVYLASRKESAGNEAVAKIKKEKNLDVKFVQLDVTDSASVEAAAAKIKKDEGKLHVLVNNAGISEMDKPQTADKPNLAAIRATFETNVFGMIQTTAAFIPLLRASNTPDAPSVILNVSTDMASNGLMAGPNGFLHQAIAYNTSKAAANSYTIALAHELKDEGIKVNAVTPGFTSTKLNGFAAGGKTPEQGATLLMEWALLDKNGKTGLFIGDKGEFPW